MVPDFSVLISALRFDSASAAVLAGFVLLAGFGLIVYGGHRFLEAIGIQKNKEMINGMSKEDFKTLTDMYERSERRKRVKCFHKEGLF